jgi:hypothetical protein
MFPLPNGNKVETTVERKMPRWSQTEVRAGISLESTRYKPGCRVDVQGDPMGRNGIGRVIALHGEDARVIAFDSGGRASTEVTHLRPLYD